MLKAIRRLLGLERSFERLEREIEHEIADSFDFSDPNARVGASLYFIINRQLEALDLEIGKAPFEGRYATDKARGALVGTAIGVVQQEFGAAPHKPTIDATITAFVLVYGVEIGRATALEALRASAEGNDALNRAADWAVMDTKVASENGASSSPAAFYLAVSDMI